MHLSKRLIISHRLSYQVVEIDIYDSYKHYLRRLCHKQSHTVAIVAGTYHLVVSKNNSSDHLPHEAVTELQLTYILFPGLFFFGFKI
jgi:hypothetical protein